MEDGPVEPRGPAIDTWLVGCIGLLGGLAVAAQVAFSWLGHRPSADTNADPGPTAATPTAVATTPKPAPPPVELPPEGTEPPVLATFPRAALSGPGGEAQLPLGQTVIVNVWLQGCGDCLPAFEAMRDLEKDGWRAGTPVVNVAYGSATTEWATSYGVDVRLVFDGNGAEIVRPLGISTFTTFVVDAQGRVRLRALPTDAGFAARVAWTIKALAAR